jgi:hypothetical protein
MADTTKTAATAGGTDLPSGKTCGDCAHIRRCKAMFGHVETDTYCDWAPSRYREVVANG